MNLPNNDWFEKHLPKLINARHYLHAHPEVSGKEFETQKYISDWIDAHCSGFQLKKAIAKTGLLIQFTSNQKGPQVLLRADIDALPIKEQTAIAYQSKNKGVAHLCGHDGHTAILLGVALWLSQHPVEKGRVLLLFQPAEETGEGAKSVVADGLFVDFEIDFVFALHNLPGYPLGAVVYKDGAFTAGVKSLIFRFVGKTAHAAEPKKATSPEQPILKLLHYTNGLSQADAEKEDFFLATTTYVKLGEVAHGTTPGMGEVHVTLRAFSPSIMDEKTNLIQALLENLRIETGLEIHCHETEVFEACLNDQVAGNMIKRHRDKHPKSPVSQWPMQELQAPFKWGEDFGLFTQQVSGAYFGIGAGLQQPALHRPEFDFPDALIEVGVAQFCGILHEIHTQ
jgi:amidohydrolase